MSAPLPTAVIGGSYFGQPGDSLSFDASGSTDGDGTIARLLWDFGDGSGFVQGATVTHSYINEEIYALTVAVTDNDGLTSAIATTVTISANPGNAQGAAFYNQHCFACHGTGGTGGSAPNITGTTVEAVNAAVLNIPAMQSISLTATEVQLIVDFIASGGGEPPPRPTDGPGLFTLFCAACHGADGRGGSAIAVTGAPFQMISEGIANIPAMQNIILSLTETQLIADFLIAGGAGDIPIEGKGLYNVFCSTCHGDGGHGGKFFAVTGAPNEMIAEAIANEPWMHSLQLTSTQTQQIADYLSAGGEPPLSDDGAGLYTVFCEVCHGANGSGGIYKVVTGTSLNFVNRALNNVNLMSSLQLNSTQTQSIATFLASGGGVKPTTGPGLYHVYCETCHGQNSQGGPEERITGSSTSKINSALSGKSDMRQLAPYLTTIGPESDTAKISNFLNGQ